MIEVEKGLASQNFLDFRIHSQIRFREVGTDPAFSSIVAFPEDESLRSLLFSLTGDGLHHLPDLLRIAEEIVAHEVQPAIELENVGYGRRQVQTDDLTVGNVLEMLDDTPQAVAVSDDQQIVVILQARGTGCTSNRASSARSYP